MNVTGRKPLLVGFLHQNGGKKKGMCHKVTGIHGIWSRCVLISKVNLFSSIKKKRKLAKAVEVATEIGLILLMQN